MEDPYQKREFTLGPAGFEAGIHSLMTTIPAGMIPEAQMSGIEEMLDRIHEAAVEAEANNV